MEYTYTITQKEISGKNLFDYIFDINLLSRRGTTKEGIISNFHI